MDRLLRPAKLEVLPKEPEATRMLTTDERIMYLPGICLRPDPETF